MKDEETWSGPEAGWMKTTETELLLNLDFIIFLKNFNNNELYKVPTGRLHVRGFESCQLVNNKQQRLDSANETSEGWAHTHDETLVHRSRERKEPVGAPLHQRVEHSHMWETCLHTVVQKPGKQNKTRREAR